LSKTCAPDVNRGGSKSESFLEIQLLRAEIEGLKAREIPHFIDGIKKGPFLGVKNGKNQCLYDFMGTVRATGSEWHVPIKVVRILIFIVQKDHILMPSTDCISPVYPSAS
jgi:hypothetical protein